MRKSSPGAFLLVAGISGSDASGWTPNSVGVDPWWLRTSEPGGETVTTAGDSGHHGHDDENDGTGDATEERET